MRVLERCPGRLAMILENQDVPEALIVFQVEHSVPECPQDVLDLLFRHRRESAPVVGSFYNNFVSANTIHPVKHTFAFPVEITLNPQPGDFFRAPAPLPARCIPRAATARVLSNIVGRLRFVAVTKRADSDTL